MSLRNVILKCHVKQSETAFGTLGSLQEEATLFARAINNNVTLEDMLKSYSSFVEHVMSMLLRPQVDVS